MIIVTGGAGFIGSALVWKLNEQGRRDIVIVDRLGQGDKWQNLAKRQFEGVLHKDELFSWLEGEGSRQHIEAIFHLGACSSTTERDVDYLVRNNLNYSLRLWDFCAESGIPFIYASSAATYGNGSQGFADDEAALASLRPMNPYGFSKQKFDAMVVERDRQPPFWAGLKFFNVYGPQEYHKGSQSSVVCQWVPQVQQTGRIRLFKSYAPGYADGAQLRDFVYVKDVVDVLWHLFQDGGRKAESGIYNLGTGEARTFLDLARATLAAIPGSSSDAIDMIEMPVELRAHYQYFTQATLTNLRERAGYLAPFTTIEDGVRDYVTKYLLSGDLYL